MHCPSQLQSFTKFYWAVFQRNCADRMFQKYLSFWSNFKVQKGGNSKKKNGIKISCGYAHLHGMSFITAKFHETLLSSFRGVVLTRKTGLMDWLTDWLTNGRVKNIIPSATRCVRYKYQLNVSPLFPRMLCAKFEWNWTCSSDEEIF